MHDVRFWETADEPTTISLCTEGCIHLKVGRAVIKMTEEEFCALAQLTDRAVREIQFAESTLTLYKNTGHRHVE